MIEDCEKGQPYWTISPGTELRYRTGTGTEQNWYSSRSKRVPKNICKERSGVVLNINVKFYFLYSAATIPDD